MATPAPPPSTRPAAPRPTRGGTTTLFKNQRLGAALRECRGPLANRMRIPFQRPGHRRGRPTLRQQPHRVPPFSFPWRRRSVHPPPHLRLVHAPPTQQRSHLRHAQQQRPLRFPDPLRSSQRPPSYPNPVRVSPWLWFSCHAARSRARLRFHQHSKNPQTCIRRYRRLLDLHKRRRKHLKHVRMADSPRILQSSAGGIRAQTNKNSWASSIIDLMRS